MTKEVKLLKLNTFSGSTRAKMAHMAMTLQKYSERKEIIPIQQRKYAYRIYRTKFFEKKHLNRSYIPSTQYLRVKVVLFFQPAVLE